VHYDSEDSRGRFTLTSDVQHHLLIGTKTYEGSNPAQAIP